MASPYFTIILMLMGACMLALVLSLVYPGALAKPFHRMIESPRRDSRELGIPLHPIPVQPASSGDGRILIVDDDPATRSVLERQLSPQYCLALAENGALALAMLELHCFQLVLVDVTMDGASGHEVTRRIRERYAASELPIILLAARNKPAHVSAGFEAGANDYVSKPIVKAELLARINTHLTLQKSAAANEALRQTNRFKSDLLALLAHDLRSPLNAITGLTGLLREDAPWLDKEKLIGRIEQAAQHALRQLTHLLQDAAAENGGLTVRQSMVDTAGVAEAARQQLVRRAEQKGQRILLNAPQRLTALADEARLLACVENLLDNAVKFSPPGTTVWLNVEPHGGHVRISVRDEGPGLSATDQRFLFQKFHRLSARPTGNEPTFGLGLAITHQLVELQRGRIWAENNGTGQGSTFTIELPTAV